MNINGRHIDGRTVAQMGANLTEIEASIAALRARQVALVNELDRAQAPQTDGSRSMVEWVQSHLDVSTETSRRLVFAARRIARHRYISLRLANARCTFDRAIATLTYAEAGAPQEAVLESFDRDLAGVSRLTARRRHITRHDEQRMFSERYFAMQPTLDESSYRLWSQLPGIMGKTLEAAIFERADEIKITARNLPSPRGQRQADALVAIAQDSLDGRTSAPASDPAPHVTVFVDAARDEPAETSAEVAFGPRVGPQTLEQILCTGRVQVVGLDNGTPVVSSRATRAIPPAIRHAVLHRDGGCTIDGCRSRYRLEPHHITPWSCGGDHSMGNLTTLCWYHHHVAIHGSGYIIDPDSPPHRRRLLRHPIHARGDPP